VLIFNTILLHLSLSLPPTPPTTFPSQSQFLAWNSNIRGSCSRVADGQRVCMEAPGGTWTTPSVTITAPTGTALYYTTATPAYPTQSGTTESCGKYYQVVSGDDCATVNLRFGFDISQLQSLNTYLDDNCSISGLTMMSVWHRSLRRLSRLMVLVVWVSLVLKVDLGSKYHPIPFLLK
jgi:hypothetical protein